MRKLRSVSVAFLLGSVLLGALAGCSREQPVAVQAPAQGGGRFDEEAVKRMIRLDRLEGENHRATQR